MGQSLLHEGDGPFEGESATVPCTGRIIARVSVSPRHASRETRGSSDQLAARLCSVLGANHCSSVNGRTRAVAGGLSPHRVDLRQEGWSCSPDPHLSFHVSGGVEGTVGMNILNAVTLGASGEMFVGGAVDRVTVAGSYYPFAAKLDANHAILWKWQVGGALTC